MDELDIRAGDGAGPAFHRELIEPPRAFTFAWSGIAFRGNLTAAPGDGDPRLVITADLGVLPYTAENGEARFCLARELGVLGRLPDGFTLDAADHVLFSDESRPPDPLTLTSLITTLAIRLLQIGSIVVTARDFMRPDRTPIMAVAAPPERRSCVN